MKVQSFRNDEERAILTGVIVNDQVCARVTSKAGKEPFRSKWSNLVYHWTTEFFEKYQKAPRGHVQQQLSRFAEKSKDEETIGIVEKFLSGLSDDYKKLSRDLNEDFLVDQASKYFTRVRIEKQMQRTEACLDSGEIDEAEQICKSFQPVDLSTDSMVSLFDDPEPWKEVFSREEEETLIQYPGALGEFFGPVLQRDGFIAFLAPEKKGKSMFLLDMAWRAATKDKRKTLFYSVGDMSQRQMMRRIVTRTIGRPLGKKPIRIPKRIRLVEGSIAKVKGVLREFDKPLYFKEVAKAVKEIKLKTAQSTSTLKMRCTPNSTTRVADIEVDIEDQIRHGWVPDVVVIDYADILAPERNLGDDGFRHQTDETWKALRRMSQKYHVLVVTATQANSASYTANLLRRQNFSEDKRKLAHVTGMAGINQNEDEKKVGIFRLNWILLREEFYTESRCVTVAGCLSIASPCMISVW